MQPTCFLPQSRLVHRHRFQDKYAFNQTEMTFATAEYSPPEHTPPGWTREQFMDYFAGVVEVPRFPLFVYWFTRDRTSVLIAAGRTTSSVGARLINNI